MAIFLKEPASAPKDVKETDVKETLKQLRRDEIRKSIEVLE